MVVNNKDTRLPPLEEVQLSSHRCERNAMMGLLLAWRMFGTPSPTLAHQSSSLSRIPRLKLAGGKQVRLTAQGHILRKKLATCCSQVSEAMLTQLIRCMDGDSVHYHRLQL